MLYRAAGQSRRATRRTCGFPLLQDRVGIALIFRRDRGRAPHQVALHDLVGDFSGSDLLARGDRPDISPAIPADLTRHRRFIGVARMLLQAETPFRAWNIIS